MNTPAFYTPESLKATTANISVGLPDGRWVAARPEGWGGLCLRARLRAAWLVFTGRADVLQWIEQPSIAAATTTGGQS